VERNGGVAAAGIVDSEVIAALMNEVESCYVHK